MLKAGLIRAERGDYVGCGSVWNSSKETFLLEVSLQSKSLFVNEQVANFNNNVQCHIGTVCSLCRGVIFSKGLTCVLQINFFLFYVCCLCL